MRSTQALNGQKTAGESSEGVGRSAVPHPCIHAMCDCAYVHACVHACRWGKRVVVYGDSSLRKDHPVVEFLSKQGKCNSLHYYKEG